MIYSNLLSPERLTRIFLENLVKDVDILPQFIILNVSTLLIYFMIHFIIDDEKNNIKVKFCVSILISSSEIQQSNPYERYDNRKKDPRQDFPISIFDPFTSEILNFSVNFFLILY